MKQKGNMYIFNVSMPPAMLEDIDAWAEKENRGRSDFIRQAVRMHIDSLKRKEKRNL